MSFTNKGKIDLNHSLGKQAVDINIYCQKCSRYVCFATETSCGHLFCEQCIQEYLLFLQECPVCLTFITHRNVYSNIALDGIVHDYVKHESKPKFRYFQKRLREYKDKKASSRVTSYKDGMRVDARDEYGLWRMAKIERVLHYLSGQTFQVRFLRGKQTFPLLIEDIAVLGTYTNRPELPNYRNSKIKFQRNGQTYEMTDRIPTKKTKMI